eukprot:755-Heterococcus_DN1.PRE.3
MKFSLVTVLAVAFSDVQSTQAFVSGKPPKVVQVGIQTSVFAVIRCAQLAVLHELVPGNSPGGYVTAFQRVGEKNLYFELGKIMLNLIHPYENSHKYCVKFNGVWHTMLPRCIFYRRIHEGVRCSAVQ